MERHLSIVDHCFYNVDLQDISNHIVGRHIRHDQDVSEGNQFYFSFFSRFYGEDIEDYIYHLICHILDNGDFVEQLGNDGFTQVKKWYLNYMKLDMGLTGYGSNQYGGLCLLKGVELVAHYVGSEGIVHDYAVRTLYPKGVDSVVDGQIA